MRPTILVILLFCFRLLHGQSGPETITLAGLLERAGQIPHPASQTDSLANLVKSAYYTLLYQIQKYDLLRQEEILMDDLDHVAETRYREGDIDLLEKTGMKARLSWVSTAVSILEDEITITDNTLKRLLQSDRDFIPADTVLGLYMINKDRNPGRVTDPTLQENMELELTLAFKKLRYFEQDGLELAHQLLEINRLRYEKEDISYSEFTLAVEKSTDIRLEYLETLEKYNQTAIQLEQYAY